MVVLLLHILGQNKYKDKEKGLKKARIVCLAENTRRIYEIMLCGLCCPSVPLVVILSMLVHTYTGILISILYCQHKTTICAKNFLSISSCISETKFDFLQMFPCWIISIINKLITKINYVKWIPDRVKITFLCVVFVV